MAITVFVEDEFIRTKQHAGSPPASKGAPVMEQLPGVEFAGNALDVKDVTKTFGKDQKPRSWRWPWKKQDEAGAKDKVADATAVAAPVTGDGKPNDESKHNGKKKITAVEHVSLTVKQHEIFGILGANGSGKSTLIRLVSTLLIPEQGSVTVFGHDVRKDELAVKRLINRVSVDAAFFKKLSPMENLIYAARLYGLEARPAQQKSVEILIKLGIEKDSIYRPLEDMSRGMQQKVAIARAFLTSPILLLLDEPTTGLDPRSKRDVQEFVLNLRDTHDTTILLTTHDMEEADRLCDRIAVLHKGKIVALDTPASLKAQVPQNGHEITLEDVFMHYTGKTAADLKNEEG